MNTSNHSVLFPPSGKRRDVARVGTAGFLVILLIALVFRVAWGMVALHRADDSTVLSLPDEQQYWLMAGSIHAGAGMRDELGFRATRMPLYVSILSVFAAFDEGVVAAKVLHWFVGALGAALVACAGAALFGRTAGMTAGLLAAVDPFLVFTSSLLLTETFFVASLVGLWWVAWPLVSADRSIGTLSRWIWLGVMACLTVYLRVSSLGLVLALVLLVVICHRGGHRAFAGAILALATVVLGLCPWAIRNREVTGEWCWLTNRGGISLYDGVGPQADGSSDLGDIKQMAAVQGLSEAEWNRFFMRESMASIREDPGRILRLACVKLRRLWNPFPNVDTHQSWFERLISAGWMIPLYACTVAGIVWWLFRQGRGGVPVVVFLMLPAIYLSLLHSVFVGSVRYRLGATPMMEMMAAWFVVTAWSRLRGHDRTGNESIER